MKRWLSRRKRALIECAPISDEPPSDRAMRSALEIARTIPETAASLTAQQQFDQALAGLVGRIQIPQEAAEWFVNANLIRGEKRSWKKTARHPAILATVLAVLVMTGIGVFFFVERLHEFPGSETAKRLLVFANATRRYSFESLNTDAINLGDYFFMKSQLEHYDVPMQFADLRARAVRVFDDEDGHRVAQVVLADRGVQFFLYPADKSSGQSTPKPETRPTWGYVEGENWAGAVQEHDGVCFMIAMHGTEDELRAYLADRAR
ncbi:MAG TPA: hypothetical protein VGL24_10660 [Chthoniobacterales bacterium]|jgi:hypothetical protein